MTANEMRQVMAFESGLEVGDEVRVNWTSCHCRFSARAEVVKVNGKSFVTRLLEPVPYDGSIEKGYPVGQTIKAPRLDDLKGWTANNRVEPVRGY